jgi:hypothetical protein
MSPGTTTKKRLAVTLAAALATSGLATATGTLIGPDYTQGSLPSEAVGRQAIQLTGQGQYVEFTTPSATNSLDLRYSLPQGKSGQLAVYVNGAKLSNELNLTSKYSYLNTGQIGGSKTHKLFDETRMLLGQNVAAGAKIKVQVDAEDTAGPYTVDLADFEQVAGPASAPANSVSLTSYGATPNDGTDDTSAFRNAIAGAKSQGKELWIPPGTFEIGQAVQVDQVTIRGAGPWYSVLHGNNVFNNGSASGNIKLYDFAVFGEISDRNDGSPDNAFHGVLGAGSVVSGLWIQHTIENNRILDTTADGINFDGTVTNSTLHNNFLRNNGDDGLALWSNGTADSGNTLSNNTVEVPTLANGIALYGGSGNTVTGNLVQDTNALGGGILVGNRFSSVPLSGTVTVSNWQFGVGALWFDARDEAITGVTINVTNFRAVDSPYEAIQFIDGNGAGKVIQGSTNQRRDHRRHGHLRRAVADAGFGRHQQPDGQPRRRHRHLQLPLPDQQPADVLPRLRQQRPDRHVDQRRDLAAAELRPAHPAVFGQQRGARPAGVGQWLAGRVPAGQRRRRQLVELLGKHQQRLPAVADRGPRRFHERQQSHAEAAAVVVVGRAHRDADHPGQHRWVELLDDRRLAWVQLRPRQRQRRDGHLPGDKPAVCPAEHHRKHRLAGRADFGARGEPELTGPRSTP